MQETYIKGNYRAYYTWQGWQIEKDEYSLGYKRTLYLSKVYKGHYSFMLDYLYAKSFKNLETAKKHIDIMIEQEANNEN